MRVHICAIGRLRSGPEHELIEDYKTRFDRTGRALSIGPLNIHQIDDRKGGGPDGQAALLERACPAGALRVALDERGKTLSSPQLADKLATWRDNGRQDIAFLIGGADGLQPQLAQGADMMLSLGKMVWPHMLARVMLTEQLYRAASILSGAPYHRA